jgi:hypothetical protein
MMRCFWITLLQTPMSWAFIVVAMIEWERIPRGCRSADLPSKEGVNFPLMFFYSGHCRLVPTNCLFTSARPPAPRLWPGFFMLGQADPRSPALAFSVKSLC